MNSTAIQRPTGLLSMDQWHIMREQADVLVKSGFLPREVNTAEKALAIIQKGRELGIQPMYALSNIAIINGKPVAGAEVLLALIYRDHGDDAIHFTETTGQRCTISYARRTWTRRENFTFALEDAKRAQLLGKDNWQKYPDAMLRARCVSAVARLAFPDSISGLYTPEEMGAAVEVNPDTGEIMTVESAAREIPPESAAARPLPASAAPGATQPRRADPPYGSDANRANGASPPPQVTQPQADDSPRINADDQAKIRSAVAALGWNARDCQQYLAQFGAARFSALTVEQAQEVLPDLEAKAAQVQGAPA
jgi:RecT family